MTYTSYMPAITRQERSRTADPWPSYESIMVKARAAFAHYSTPARFGSLASDWAHYARPGLYCRLADGAMLTRRPIRVATEHLPTIRMEDWLVYQNAPRDVAAPPEPQAKAPRKLARVHRFLAKLIAWRQGL